PPPPAGPDTASVQTEARGHSRRPPPHPAPPVAPRPPAPSILAVSAGVSAGVSAFSGFTFFASMASRFRFNDSIKDAHVQQQNHSRDRRHRFFRQHFHSHDAG